MGNSGKEEQDMVLKLMKTLKLDNFTQKKEKTLTEQMLEHQIWEIENTEPCECEDLEKYKDFCNIEADWFKYVVSAVKNLIAGTKEYPLIPRKKDQGDVYVRGKQRYRYYQSCGKKKEKTRRKEKD